MFNAPRVSVVIPAYNCEKIILQTIEALRSQTYSPINIIVVDDGSVDHTSEVIQKFKEVKYIYQENAGPAAARNRGAQEVSEGLIFFTDSDCIPEIDWIEKMLPAFDDDSVGVVAGSYGISNPQSILARCIHKEILYRHHHLMPQYPKVFGSYNFGVRKKVFESVGGFNANYRQASGEDNDLSYKISKSGRRIYFEKTALVNHFHPTSFKKYLQEQYRHGFWRVKMYVDHPDMAKGDGYTFWKDIFEIPWASLIIAIFFLMPTVSLVLAIVLSVVEIFYGIVMTRNFLESFVLSSVMFFRAFLRFFGLSSGVIYFLYKKILKKDN